MARKPFKTLEEQVAIFESRGLSMPEYAAYALLGEDYYCVVNGYKEPFLDKEASAEAGHDVYAEGTGFGDLYGLFLFDRDLRNLTFKYLLKAEARVRSVAAYTFSEAYRELDAYLKIANYTDAKDYMVGPSVSVNIIFTIFANAFSPIAPTRIRRIRQRGCAAFGA